MKKILMPLFLTWCLLILTKEIAAQTPNSSTLNSQGLSLPAGFYISSVIDERALGDTSGALFFSENGRSSTHKIILRSGSFGGIKKLLMNSAPKNTSLRPLVIRVKQYKIRETVGKDDRVSGEVNLLFVFDMDKESGPVPLSQYKTTARYTRPVSNLSIVESTLLNLTGSSLKFIDSWMNAQASVNPKLAKGIKLSFRDYLEQHEDTVYYSATRPLVWDDFREKRSDSRYAAAVFPSFGYDQQAHLTDGIINVELVLKVFVVKSASWVSPGIQSIYNLRHEQKHFELVKLVAERFKKKLLAEKLTPDNYQGIINFEYLEFYREMNKVQKEYDEQTAHGRAPEIQEEWNRKIDAELAQIGN